MPGVPHGFGGPAVHATKLNNSYLHQHTARKQARFPWPLQLSMPQPLFYHCSGVQVSATQPNDPNYYTRLGLQRQKTGLVVFKVHLSALVMFSVLTANFMSASKCVRKSGSYAAPKQAPRAGNRSVTESINTSSCSASSSSPSPSVSPVC